METRSSKSILDTDAIAFLYKEILLLYESDEPLLDRYKVNGSSMKEAQKEVGFHLAPCKKLAEVNSKIGMNTFSYRADIAIPDLFRHLRNAFVHNRIMKDKNGALLLKDYNNKKLAMFARVESFEKLKAIIKSIKQTRE